MHDVVVTKKSEDRYVAVGGDGDILFSGEGLTVEEAVGRWLIANREAIGFQFSVICEGEFKSSTRYGKNRSSNELGKHEKRAFEEFTASRRKDG